MNNTHQLNKKASEKLLKGKDITMSESKTLEEWKKDFDEYGNRWYIKYFWHPLHWYFLNHILFNPLNWIRRLPFRIKFRIKHKCPYEDTWSLKDTFYDWIYPRLTYVIKEQFETVILSKEQKRGYKKMIKLLEYLKDADFYSCNNRTNDTAKRKHEEFMDLLKEHLFYLWI